METYLERTDICFACALDDMFSGFETTRKVVWLKLTQLECASDRKDSSVSKKGSAEKQSESVYQGAPRG